MDESATFRELENSHGEVLTTKEAMAKYEFHTIQAPYVAVTRKSDGVKGSLGFQARPRFYYSFLAD